MKITIRSLPILIGFSLLQESHAGCPRDDLRLNEILFCPKVGESQFVEIRNSGVEEITLAGVTLVSGDASYTIPETVTESMGAGDLVLVVFDGADAATNDLSFTGDNLITLHAEPEGFLGDTVGHCGLYRAAGVQSPQLLLDFVAWGGEPGDSASDAVSKGVWLSDSFFIHTKPDEFVAGPSGPTKVSLEKGETLGRNEKLEWILVPETRVSAGLLDVNPFEAPALFEPVEDSTNTGDPGIFRWSDYFEATGYELQIASDVDFNNLVQESDVDAATITFSESFDVGEYWWRVRANYSETDVSDWSEVYRFEVLARPEAPDAFVEPVEDAGDEKKAGKEEGKAIVGPDIIGLVYDETSFLPLSGVTITVGGMTTTTNVLGYFQLDGLANGGYTISASLTNYETATAGTSVGNLLPGSVAISMVPAPVTVGVTAFGARKETTMLAITPNSRTGNQLPRTGATRWDIPLPRATVASNDLESWWCWAVSARMINRFYGGSMANDQIVWHTKKDLTHSSDSAANLADCQTALSYALGTTSAGYTTHSTKPSAATVRAYLAAGRPLYFAFGWPRGNSGHVVTVNAYRFQNKKMQINCLNDDNNGTNQWISYDTLNNRRFFVFYVPLASSTGAAADTGLGSGSPAAPDGDGDGVNNFDEATRMTAYYTAKGSSGSLSSGTNDSDGDSIQDKAEIASWVFRQTGPNRVVADVDGDKRYPELDKDSDDGGIEDGEEDLDKDGTYDAGDTPPETDVFDRADDKVLDLAFVVDSTGSMSDDIAAVKANLNSILDRVIVQFPNWRIAVVDYRDYPPEDSIPYRANVAFTSDEAAVRSAINGLSASGGGDFPESLFTALINTINAVSLTDSEGNGWRGTSGDGIKRAIVYMTDASAQSPEPVTGYTASSVIVSLIGGGLRFGDPTSAGSRSIISRDGSKSVKADADERSGSISLYPIVIGGSSAARSDADALVAGASGEVIAVSGASQVADAIISAIDDIAVTPDAILSVTDESGGSSDLRGEQFLVADLSRSFDPDGCGIVSYDWDWDADGTYDESSVVPVLTHDYGESGFGGSLRARITTFSGTTAVANFTLETTSLVNIDSTGSITLNAQTGLYEQTITVSNPGSSTIDAIRILFGDLPPEVEIRGGTTEGSTIVFSSDLLPGESVEFVIEYYNPLREAFEPTITAELTTKTTLVNPVGPTFGVLRFENLGEDGNLLEFATIPGRSYHIQYSEDMANWRTVYPVIDANNTSTQWIDNGPPKTECHPTDCPGRFYRVLELNE